MSLIWIFLLSGMVQGILASDAEDFNPFDHILQSPPQRTNEDVSLPAASQPPPSSNDLIPSKGLNNDPFNNERCVCTCPMFDIPNVAKSSREVYIGHADNAEDCSCSRIVLPLIQGTVWKFQGFSITQILREINFWDSKSTKSAIVTHFEALN